MTPKAAPATIAGTSDALVLAPVCTSANCHPHWRDLGVRLPVGRGEHEASWRRPYQDDQDDDCAARFLHGRSWNREHAGHEESWPCRP